MNDILIEALEEEELQETLTAFFKACCWAVIKEGDTDDFLNLLNAWNDAGLNDDETHPHALETAYKIAIDFDLEYLIPEDRDSSNDLYRDNIAR